VNRSLWLPASLASFAAWGGLLLLRGGFWRVGLDEHHRHVASEALESRVEAVVPARDEVATIATAIGSLAEQRYSGAFAVTLVDDDSSDGTAQAARAALAGRDAAARLSVIAGRPLRAGWTGKLNALDAGVEAVLRERGAPAYWLFTDADIAHDPGNVAALVAKARSEGLDLASLMVRLRSRSGWERLLVPAFVFFFRKLYPFAWSNDPAKRTAAAAGGCVLISHAALERIGGLGAISGRLIDDCALAAAVKNSGGRIWIGMSERTTSVRAYESLETLWAMVARTAFTQLDHSYPLVALAVGGMVLLYAVPAVTLLGGMLARDGTLASAGAAGTILMCFAYAPTLRAYDEHPLAALALPVAAMLYAAMTVDSARRHLLRRGGAWKGRTYGADAGRASA
jgi:hopene-associated glycosyltransferase HpnB